MFPVDGVMGKTWDMLGLATVMKAAGVKVPEREWHAMRHTFSSQFMMAGGNILTLQKLLGHGSVQMTMIYAHLAPDFMASEVARMAFPAPLPTEVADMAEERRKREMDTQRETGTTEPDRVAVNQC